MKEKTCTKCKLSKLLSEYHNAKRGKYGKNSVCKLCIKEYADKNKERKQLYDKQRYDNNSEAAKNRASNYYKNNKDHVKNNVKQWQENNKESVTAYKKNNKYKRREVVNSSELTSNELRAWEDNQPKICTYCGTSCPDFYNIDHITPLAKNGTHSIDNLTIACKKCNQEKSDRPFIYWFAEKQLLEVKDKKP